MGTTFRPYDRDQNIMFPPSPRDWLPEDHLVYFISDALDQLDLSAFFERYEGDGRRNQPYNPRMMLAVLVYSYSRGVFSSRKIARRIVEDVPTRYLTGSSFPQHRTISRFRQEHLQDFENLFVQLLLIAREAGLVKMGTIAIDGSKFKANASKHRAMSYGRMVEAEKKLRKEIRELTKKASEVDACEDAEHGDARGDELPEELARSKKRLRAIKEAKARLEERQRAKDEKDGRSDGDEQDPGRGWPFKRPFGKPDHKAQENFTDPESRIMKSSKGFQQSYNAQTAVDRDSQLIVAAEVSNQAADSARFVPILDRVKQNTGRNPERLLADAGYKSELNHRTLEKRHIDGYVAQGRKETEAKSANSQEYPATGRMARKMKSVRGKRRYRERKWIAEAPFSWIKSAIGFQQFSVRGLDKVGGEFSLVAFVVNLRRMNNLIAWT